MFFYLLRVLLIISAIKVSSLDHLLSRIVFHQDNIFQEYLDLYIDTVVSNYGITIITLCGTE